jgi:hypothetical protein
MSNMAKITVIKVEKVQGGERLIVETDRRMTAWSEDNDVYEAQGRAIAQFMHASVPYAVLAAMQKALKGM